MGGAIDNEENGCQMLRCWTMYATFNYDLDLGTSESDFKIWGISGIGGQIDMEWNGFESIWCWAHYVCDLELWPHLWSWPWNFKVKYLNSSIAWMGKSIDMEQKGYAVIRFGPRHAPYANQMKLYGTLICHYTPFWGTTVYHNGTFTKWGAF